MHLLWIETEFMYVFMYSWFEFNLAVFLCQETTFMSTNQKSNVKIDWYEQQIRFSECSCSYHITQMSEANEWIICQSKLVLCSYVNQIQFICQSKLIHMSIKFSCQSSPVLCSYINQIWFLFHSFLIRGRARLHARDYFFLNVLFANANKNKYSQQNHKWTCGCCLLILNYFLPLVSKNSRSLRTLDL